MKTENSFENAKETIKQAAKIINLPKEKIEILVNPEKEIKVTFPIKLENGKTKIFTGFRVQHNSILGPYKGGIRFSPEVNFNEVRALATWMSIKTATVGLPLGGGKGGVIVNTKELSQNEIKSITKGFVKTIYKNIGPNQDIPAPDMYTNSQIMDWITEEYSKQTKLPKKEILGVVTGKSLENGGSIGRDTATARGTEFVLLETIKQTNILDNLENKRIIIQGFGNAGMNFAKLISKYKPKIIAISDSKGGVYNEGGLDIEKLIQHKKESGSVINFENAKTLTNKEILEIDSDILVPSAMENVFTKENAHEIKTKIILEIANGPTTQEADKIFNEKGILVIPDILANAGGVTVSYYEWYQNVHKEKWNEKKVDEELKKTMKKSTKKVLENKKNYNVSMRLGAYVSAIKTISKKIK
jgi:glutamate dehydrogenase/leucine dehydrogenase